MLSRLQGGLGWVWVAYRFGLRIGGLFYGLGSRAPAR